MLLAVLVFLLSTPALRAQSGLQDCKWRQNVTELETLEHHKYLILEDCLYYFLSKNADTSYKKNNALVLLPPTKYRDSLEITVHNALVRQMWMNEAWREMHINGYMTLSWHDSRLVWDKGDWKLESLKIKTYGHLWMPDIYSNKYQTSVQANDFTLYQDIKASRSGNVTARLEYRMQAQCSVDFTNFPGDSKRCCFTLRSYLFPYLIKFKVIDEKGHLDIDSVQTNWDIKEVTLKVQEEKESGAQALEFCLEAGRKSSTLRIELTIPMVISAILVLVAPLIGETKTQLFVKMFAILLQFLCFQFLIAKTPQLGYGNTVPTIVKFYEFTLGVTLASLLLTVLMSALGRMERRLPPPHSCLLAASAVNARLCCADSDAHADAEPADYGKDWREVIAAISNLLSLLLLLVYVLGIIILTS